MRGPCSHSRALGHLKRDLFADRAKPFDRAGTDAKRSNLFFIGISHPTGQKYLRSTGDIRDLMREQSARRRIKRISLVKRLRFPIVDQSLCGAMKSLVVENTPDVEAEFNYLLEVAGES